MKKELVNEPVYNKKCLKTKIKFYNGKINTKFYDHVFPKEGFRCSFLSLILIDSKLLSVSRRI